MHSAAQGDTGSALAAVQAAGPWFYNFALPGGGTTDCRAPESTLHLHETRWRMVEATMRAELGDRLGSASVLDLGCHEGWFAARCLQELGTPSLLGVDVRAQSLEKARLVHRAMGLNGGEFVTLDAEELDAAEVGTFDVCLCVGLIYHLENPVRVLRRAAAATGELMLVETQVVDPIEGVAEWGKRDASRPYRGGFAIIDESCRFDESAEAGATPLALCPSEAAVAQVLRAVGFERVWRVACPEGGHEQLARGRRVIYAASRRGEAGS